MTSTSEVLSALSAISAGLLVSHAESFYCPTEIKEIKEIMLPSLCEAISAISDISAGRLLPHADSFYCPTEIKEIKEILLPARCAALSANSAGLLLSHADSILLSHGNKGNKGNSLTRPMRSPFCHFCGTIIISCG